MQMDCVHSLSASFIDISIQAMMIEKEKCYKKRRREAKEYRRILRKRLPKSVYKSLFCDLSLKGLLIEKINGQSFNKLCNFKYEEVSE